MLVDPCPKQSNFSSLSANLAAVLYLLLQIAREMLPTVEHSCENASVVVVNFPKRYGEESIGLFY